MNNQGAVRRTDLYLRASYPELTTTIYKISDSNYIIKCDNIEEDFAEFRKNFNHSIKLILAPADISQDVPNEYMEIIPNISDNEISKNFEGVPMTKIGLLNLLIAKFQNISFHKIEDQKRNICIYVSPLDPIDKEKLESFFKGLHIAVDFSIIEELPEQQTQELSTPFNPTQFIYAANFRKSPVSEFSLRDEAIWFDNIDRIFEGSFIKEDLFFYDPEEYSCYVDFSTFENIDLRNHLFLFQTVYVTPPFEKSIETWLKESKILKNEFLELIKRNRIKIALTQPEHRYDINFINEIYEINPKAVISRRALAALQQIDIVETSDNYIFNDQEILKELKAFCILLKDVVKIDPKFLYDLLVWPVRARRNSFEILNNSGLFGLSSFGVNTAIEKRISEAVKKDLEFDFTVNSSSIHLSNSLNAIYFPFKAKDGYTDSFYANIMGEMLNFYKSANKWNIKSFIDSKLELNSGILPISPIDIIDINDYIPIIELESVLSKDAVFPGSKRLIETLAELSEEDRKKKIAEYNYEVNEKINNKKSNKNGVIDLGQNVLTDAVGLATGLPGIGSIFSLTKMGGKKIIKSIPQIKNIAAKIEESLYSNDKDKANIHYLTKINRVARIKRDI